MNDALYHFAGHPTEAPEFFADEYGKYIMAPAKFRGGVPHVYWKYSFDSGNKAKRSCRWLDSMTFSQKHEKCKKYRGLQM